MRHTINVHMGLRTVQVALLCHDDVLDVFHGEVVTEGIVKQSLKLIHSQFLHVTLGRQKTPRKTLLAEDKLLSQRPSVTQISCSSAINSGSTGKLLAMNVRSYENIQWANSKHFHLNQTVI